jgi:hypothetical protein
MRRALAALAVLALVAAATILALAPAAPAHRLRGAPKCPIFPANNPWNQRVDKLPVARDSATLVRSIGVSDPVHPDFGAGNYGGGPIGIPYDVVGAKTQRSKVSFDYSDESDHVRYPIPRGVHIEGGRNADGDRHAILVDRSSCRLFELFDLERRGRGWHAGSGATWNLRSDHLRHAGWTSADAAGLPILPGLARWDDARTGNIDHALRFTAEHTRTSYVYPARHQAGDSGSRSLPPMGLRVRLKKSVSLRGLSRQARIVATALKRYGAILADNGSPWYISGAPSGHWNNDDLHNLGRLTGRDFEVVDTRSLPKPGH